MIKKENGIYLDDSINLDNIDGIIFDCDGVLIDITKSYDSTIDKATSHVLKTLVGISDGISITPEIIEGFKSSGGFNDEVDVTYACIISIVAAKKLQKDQNQFVNDVINNCDSSGIESAEKYIEKLTDIVDIKNKLQYPGPHHDNPLYKIFDQLFYGPELYQKLFNQTSEFFESGLIQNDVVLLDDSLIERLHKRFENKIAIVTGRGKESVKYSLKEKLEEFDLDNSVFLEDEPREMAKPNPKSLTDCISGMGCKNALYVGDSMEDLIMAKKATQTGHATIFCGIIGTSKEPEKKLQLFENNGANISLDSITMLPKVLNLE